MSYLRFTGLFSSTVLCVALLGGGCSGPTYVTVDAEVVDAAEPRDGTLVLLSEPSLAIRPGEVGAIEVRSVGPGGAPQSGVEVTFAIEGAALDSTLSLLSMRTDADGRASGGIVAGTSATSFRVRVVSRSAVLPVHVDVGVGTSFGTLVVRAPYSGARLVTRRLIDVVPRARCVDLVSSPPEVAGRALPEGSDELSIAGLPTTVRYAVLARGVSDLGTTASGCVDDVALETDTTVRVDVPYVDASLSIDGEYEATVTLETGVATEAGFALIASTVSASADARGGDSGAMLDSLERELTTRVSVPAGLAFAEARLAESLDVALEERFATDASAPTRSLLRWIDAASGAMERMELDTTLVVAGESLITTDRVTVRDAADGALALVPASFSPEMGIPHALVVTAEGTRDSVRVEGLVLDAPLGAMLLAWLDGVARSDGLAGASALLAPACGTLRTFAAELPTAAACDAACLDAACAAVITDALDDLGVAAAALDATAGVPVVAGTLSATDRDGDVRVDGITGELAGSYRNADGLTLAPVSGSIAVMRATAAD